MFGCIEIVGNENVFFDEPLSIHSTIGIGGKAKIFARPINFLDLLKIIRFAEQTSQKYKIIGNGSNILFDDNGFDGIIITTRGIVSFTELEGGHMLASAGMLASEFLAKTREFSLSGFEWAVGIPATLGGMTVMNAGANGSNMSEIIHAVTFIEDGKIRTLRGKDLNFGYRDSYFRHSETIIMSIEFVLKKDRKKMIDERIQNFLSKRLESQPHGKSLGCVFRNGTISAGKMIDEVGLKGFRVGGIEISQKHANFFVNIDNGSSNDYLRLIEIAKDLALQKFGERLEEEIEFILR